MCLMTRQDRQSRYVINYDKIAVWLQQLKKQLQFADKRLNGLLI